MNKHKLVGSLRGIFDHNGVVKTHTHHTAAVKCNRQIGWTPLFVPLAAECRDTCGFLCAW